MKKQKAIEFINTNSLGDGEYEVIIRIKNYNNEINELLEVFGLPALRFPIKAKKELK